MMEAVTRPRRTRGRLRLRLRWACCSEATVGTYLHGMAAQGSRFYAPAPAFRDVAACSDIHRGDELAHSSGSRHTWATITVQLSRPV